MSKSKKKNDNDNSLDSLTYLTFSEEAQVVLQDLFTRYPPDDGEVDNEIAGKKTEKIDKIRQKRDDIFCKPSMSRAEIAKKVESHASKMKKVAYLKQVFLT